MTMTLPAPIDRYLAADAANDVDALVNCFTPDAHVRDESHDYRGHDEIRSWKLGTMKKYTYTIEPLRVTQTGDVATVEAKVAGSFPGSPVTLRFAFTLAGERIAGLEIK
jgi:ketosteroid isomerase-like protein